MYTVGALVGEKSALGRVENDKYVVFGECQVVNASQGKTLLYIRPGSFEAAYLTPNLSRIWFGIGRGDNVRQAI